MDIDTNINRVTKSPLLQVDPPQGSRIYTTAVLESRIGNSILHDIILYHTVPYYIILYHTILY